MPEEPTPPVDPSRPPEEDAEWTDDSGFEELETPDSASAEDDEWTDEWEATSLEWEEEYPETPTNQPEPTTTKDALAWLTPLWQRLRTSWQRIIFGLRKRIPAAANLSDGMISAILIGILGILLLLLNSVRQPSVAAERSPQTISPSEPVETTSDTESLPTAPLSTATAPEVETPPAPEDVVDVERIAKIQAQLTDSSIYNASRVVDSVQADFTQNRLTLTCNDDWYRLSNYDQNLLANQLMNQSKDLSFKDLQLKTTDGNLIARNPVIGDEMVIYLREKPPEVEPPERPRYRILVDR